MAATSELIGRARACAVAEAQRTYRWIYRTVLRDWDALGELYERHGLVPIRSAPELDGGERQGGAKRAPQRRRSKKSRSSAPARTSSIPP